MTKRINWKALVPEASAIVESYDTRVTLRQLFYRLVAKQSLPNTRSAYNSLSKYCLWGTDGEEARQYVA